MQYSALNFLAKFVPGIQTPNPRDTADKSALVQKALLEFLREDAHNIGEGLYPIEVLKPESPVEHVKRLPKLITHGLSSYRKRATGKATEFNKKAKDLSEELPRYYRRNFHFQIDGYLSEHSAELYEHQVEMLFAGTGDAMRRLIIPPLKTRFPGSDGTGLTFLEVAAGTGRSSRFVRMAFPKAKIVVSDISDPYLKVARTRLADLDRMDFIQAAGEKLPFQDKQFDAVYSVFLFHELPEDVRREVLKESKRVLKKGGFLGLVDSLQSGDQKDFDSLLENFPKDYHEPFYRNYIATPMEGMMKELGLESMDSHLGFLSKVIWGKN